MWKSNKKNAAKNLRFRMRENSLCFFRLSDEMFEILNEIFDNFNKKLTAINKFRILRIKNKNTHFFWEEFQRTVFNFIYYDEILMTKMIHKLHSTFQRLIVVEFSTKSVYNLTKQCQRIYKSDFQVDKIKRIVNKINMQKQQRIRTFDVVVFFFSSFSRSLFLRQLFFSTIFFQKQITFI